MTRTKEGLILLMIVTRLGFVELDPTIPDPF